MKNLYLQNVDILEKILKDWALNKKYIAEKDDFEILDELLLPLMISEVKLHFIKNMWPHNVSILRIGS